MPMYEEPVVGAFYENEDGRQFEVTAFDENDGTIDIQYKDGTPDEIDLDDWYGMDLEQMELDEDDEDELDKVETETPADDADPEDEDEDDADPDEEDEEE